MSAEKKGVSLGCLVAIVTLSLAVLGFIAAVLVLLFGSSDPSQSYGEKIAHLDLEGIITSASDRGWAGSGESMVQRLAKDLKRAREDETVKAIVLRINSPGGEVTAADTIYHHVTKAAEKKPVVVYMDSMAASGGFYVACGASEVYANRTTMTGSIGVIISTMNYQDLFNKLGLETVVFKSGKFKDTLSGNREMRDDEKELIQGMVNQTYERFLEVVMKARPDIPEAKLRQSIADGRIISGQDAADDQLIDGTGYIEDAYDRAKELGKAPGAKVVRYSEDPSIFRALGLMQSRIGRAPQPPRIEVKLPGASAMPSLQPGMLYLLPPFYAGQ